MLEKDEHTCIGIASLILGIVGIILMFLPWIGLFFRIDILTIPITIIATVLGYFAWKYGDYYGYVGFLIGIITLIFMIIILILTTPVYFEIGSVGFNKQLFEIILDKPVNIEIVKSIINGSDSCEFIVKF